MGEKVLELTAEDFNWAWEHLDGARTLYVGRGVLNPAKNYGHLAVVDRRLLGNGRNMVVFERSVNRPDWPKGKIYHINARTKAMMSARDKTSTRLIVRQGKHRPGDFCWPGGIYKSEFGIGFSGMAPEDDELMSRIFLALAISHAYRDSERNPTEAPPENYAGGEPLESLSYDLEDEA